METTKDDLENDFINLYKNQFERYFERKQNEFSFQKFFLNIKNNEVLRRYFASILGVFVAFCILYFNLLFNRCIYSAKQDR